MRLSPGNLQTRVLSALVAVPVLVALIWLGVNTTAALVAGASAVGIWELYRLSPKGRVLAPLLFGVAAGVLFTVDAALGRSFTSLLITGVVLVPLLGMVLLPQQERAPADWAWMVAGVFLIGWTLSLAVLLRRHPDGREWLLTGLILTFAIDTAAYAVGRMVGRRRLAPSISPGKTWEGSFGAVAAGAGAAIAITAGFGLDIAWWQAMALGLLVSVFSQLGDLAESMVKRAAGAKDAGALVPGHGGMLDRLDSLIPAVAVLYYFLQYLGR